MKYLKNDRTLTIEEPTVMTLGKFDGLHMGHQYLFEHLRDERNAGLKTVIFTFDMPPRNYIDQSQYRVLTTIPEKEYVFESCGVDYLVEYPFTSEVMEMEPEAFIQMIVRQFNVKVFVIGTDFHFGHNRTGDYKVLQAFSEKYGYDLHVVKKKQYKGRDISSTFIRHEVVQGNMGLVQELLGYPYFVQEKVIKGNQIGSKIGFPTINFIPVCEKLLPPKGVYVAKIEIGEDTYAGITNIGVKPTVEGVYPMGVETNIFNFEGNLYGRTLRVYFLEFIRPEIKYDSFELLTEQIDRDVIVAKNYWVKHQNDRSYYGGVTNVSQHI